MIIKSFQDRDSILAKQLCVQESLFFYQLGSGDALTPVIDASASGLGCLHFNVLQYFTYVGFQKMVPMILVFSF